MLRSGHDHELRRPLVRVSLRLAFIGAAFVFTGCRTQHEVDVKPTHHTVQIEPIYMTVDINIRVQQELEDFYDDVVTGAPPQNEEQGESP